MAKMENNNIKKSEPPRLFGLKYVLSLCSGLAVIGLLTAVIHDVVDFWLAGPSSSIGGNTFAYGLFFVGLISTLMVFGAVYLITTWQAGKAIKRMRAEHQWVRVLAIIFASLMAVPAVIFLIMLMIPLISLGVGTAAGDSGAVAAQCVFAGIAFLITLKMIGYHLGIPKWCGRQVYVPVFALITAAAITLFMIFPGSNIRDAASDQKIVDDLDKISSAISRYADKNDQLPAALTDLGNGQLNHALTDYEYRIISDGGEKESTVKLDGQAYTVATDYSAQSHNAEYEICANGFAANTKASSYWSYSSFASFNNHSAGRDCFSKSLYIYVSSYNTQPTATIDEGYNYFEE
jgi:hypothetical protein